MWRVELTTCSQILSLGSLPCSDNISTMSHESLNLLLDLYQQSRGKGEQASLLMETNNEKDVITFQIGYLPTGSTVRKHTNQEFQEDKNTLSTKKGWQTESLILGQEELGIQRLFLKHYGCRFAQVWKSLDFRTQRWNRIGEAFEAAVDQHHQNH